MIATESSQRRPYDNSQRRERAAETRERILVAGSELLQSSSIRDWRALTVQAVAQRAGVSERTVYRHFATERRLHDAVLHRLEEQTGIDLTTLRLEDVGEVAGRIFHHVSSYPLAPRTPDDATLAEAMQRQHHALLRVVATAAPGWSERERSIAAAVLDVLWSVGTYERLVMEWHLDTEDAIEGVGWVIGLVESAVRGGPPPSGRRPSGKAGRRTTGGC